ncbi:MAG: transposase [Alphaproteobacteria bacterium]
MVDLTGESEIEGLSAAGAAGRRPWNDAEKLRIVEESFAGHRQASATARRHGISRSPLTVWGRQSRNGELGVGRSPSFIPLTLSAEAPARLLPVLERT